MAQALWGEIAGPIPFLSQAASAFGVFGGNLSRSPVFAGLDAMETTLKGIRKAINRPSDPESWGLFFKGAVEVASWGMGTGNLRRVYNNAAQGFEDLKLKKTVNPFRLFFKPFGK